ncbi:MAG: type II toxin-antitoxin system HipA family toxin [Bacteroidales bacterium]|nr:type II toxin-antitoxin system HipA family toxin [Bacteroidales bacterium]
MSVLLWGEEVCRLEWLGGYKEHFGKIGSLVSFSPQYASLPWDLDPLGPYGKNFSFFKVAISDWCRAKDYEGIPRFMSGSLPDDWGNAVFSAWASQNNLRRADITAVEKLAFIGKRGMGALEFVPSRYNADDAHLFVLEELFAVADEIRKQRESLTLDINSNPGINDLMAVGMSAGGKHPKAIVAINWQTGEIKSGQVSLPEQFVHYVLKFRDSDIWPTGDVEYAYYLMAAKAGITMTPSRLIPISGANHFLTERFDRVKGEKLHVATLNSLVGPVSSYESAFRTARGLNLDYADREQLFRRMVFNYLSGVCDDHDKNISFIMEKSGRWRLSPAYDETFTVNFLNPFIGDRHAMTVRGLDRNLKRDDYLRFAVDNDIHSAEEIIDEVFDAVMSFQSIAKELELPSPVEEIILKHINKPE